MDITLGALVIASFCVAAALFISNIRMTNRMIKEFEERKKNSPWNWN